MVLVVLSYLSQSNENHGSDLTPTQHCLVKCQWLILFPILPLFTEATSLFRHKDHEKRNINRMALHISSCLWGFKWQILWHYISEPTCAVRSFVCITVKCTTVNPVISLHFPSICNKNLEVYPLIEIPSPIVQQGTQLRKNKSDGTIRQAGLQLGQI